jgi:hypothetical protein
MLRMKRLSAKLGKISIPQAVKRAKKIVPQTFNEPLPVEAVSLERALYMEPQGHEAILVLRVNNPTGDLIDQHEGITRGIDIQSGRYHPWAPLNSVIKLAVLPMCSHLHPSVLAELESHLPATIDTNPGYIRRTTLGFSETQTI